MAHSFTGKKLHVEPVPVTNTVLVRNMPHTPRLTEEKLENLFSNTRYSGGQDVTSVSLDGAKNRANITFADPSGRHYLQKNALYRPGVLFSIFFK